MSMVLQQGQGTAYTQATDLKGTSLGWVFRTQILIILLKIVEVWSSPVSRGVGNERGGFAADCTRATG